MPDHSFELTTAFTQMTYLEEADYGFSVASVLADENGDEITASYVTISDLIEDYVEFHSEEDGSITDGCQDSIKRLAKVFYDASVALSIVAETKGLLVS